MEREMKTILRLSLLASAAALAFMAEVSYVPSRLPVIDYQLVPDARAVAGVRRRAHRRGVAVGAAAGASSAAAAQPQQTTAEAQPAAAPQPAASPPPPVYGPLAQGTIVNQLPAGCQPVTTGGVEYQHCGENYFRTAFQGNALVYVAGNPGQ